MASQVVVPANVLTSSGASKKTGTAGVTITQGQVLYLDAADGKLKLADANGAAAARVVEGIAINAAAAGQPISYITRDPAFKPGFAVVVGEQYILASDTPGSIALHADAVSGDFVTGIGIGKSVTEINIQGFSAAGAVKS
jgi:hypothetical protein